MADPYPFDPSGLNQPAGTLPQLTTLDNLLSGLLNPPPTAPTGVVAPVAQLVADLPGGQLVTQPQPVIPPMWLADP